MYFFAGWGGGEDGEREGKMMAVNFCHALLLGNDNPSLHSAIKLCTEVVWTGHHKYSYTVGVTITRYCINICAPIQCPRTITLLESFFCS